MRASREQGVYYLLCFHMHFTAIQPLLITAESPQTLATEFCVSIPEILPWFHFTVNKVRHQQSNLSNVRP